MENTVTRFTVAFKGQTWQRGAKRATVQAVNFYITGVSWGDGSQVKSVTMNKDRSKACGFSRSTAESIVAQYRHRFASIEAL